MFMMMVVVVMVTFLYARTSIKCILILILSEYILIEIVFKIDVKSMCFKSEIEFRRIDSER